MRKLTIVLNHLPDSQLNPNQLRRLHWSQRVYLTRNARTEVGRVNSLKRMRHFWHFADSFDGTDYVHHPHQSVRLYLPEMKRLKQQLELA